MGRYKVWVCATSTGSGVWFEPYGGVHTKVQDTQLGQGPNVALVEKSKLVPGSELYFDNLFTSVKLLEADNKTLCRHWNS